MWEPNLVNYTQTQQHHYRPLVMKTGFHRLSLFAAALGAGAALLFCFYAYIEAGPNIHWPRFIIFVTVITALATTAAWALVRGLAWVAAGFRRDRFSKPNWN
jgi:hypothetical protein